MANPCYPSRNEARSILYNLDSLIKKKNLSVSLNQITTYCILQYTKKYKIDFVTYVFTNALVDMFPDMNVNNENAVDMNVLMNSDMSISTIDAFFLGMLNQSFEDWIEEINKNELVYTIKLDSQSPVAFDVGWFNNCDNFIHPLLISYQDLKKRKEMLFQKDDIKQIPIDYSLALCYNHSIQKGYLNRTIVAEICNKLTTATNNAINTYHFTQSDIEETVSEDLLKPKCVRAAYDFIKKI